MENRFALSRFSPWKPEAPAIPENGCSSNYPEWLRRFGRLSIFFTLDVGFFYFSRLQLGLAPKQHDIMP